MLCSQPLKPHDSHSEKYTALQRSNTDVACQLATARNSIRELNQQLVEQRELVDQQALGMDDLREELAKARSELAISRKKCQALSAQAAKTECVVQCEKDESTQLRGELSKTRAELAQRKAELTECRAEAAKAAESAWQAAADRSALQKKAAELASQLQEADARLAEVNEEMEGIREEVDVWADRYQQSSHDLHHTRDRLQSASVDLGVAMQKLVVGGYQGFNGRDSGHKSDVSPQLRWQSEQLHKAQAKIQELQVQAMNEVAAAIGLLGSMSVTQIRQSVMHVQCVSMAWHLHHCAMCLLTAETFNRPLPAALTSLQLKPPCTCAFAGPAFSNRATVEGMQASIP